MSEKQDSKAIESQITKRVLRGGLWVLVCRIAGISLALLSNVVLARLLSPSQFGLFVLSLSIISFACIVGRFGLDRVLVRFLSEHLGKNNRLEIQRTLLSAFRMGLVSALTAAVACFLFLFFFGVRLFRVPDSNHFFFLVAACLLLMTVMQIVAEAFRGLHELKYSSVFHGNHTGPLINLAFLALLFGIGSASRTAEWALGVYALSIALVCPIALLLLWRTVARHLKTLNDGRTTDQQPTRVNFQLVGICLPMMMAQLLAFASAEGDVWIAGACCQHQDVALYGAARRIMVTVAMPLGMINLAVISSIAELHVQGRRHDLQELLQKSATLAAVPCVMVLLTIIVLPGPILTLIFGPSYRDASLVLVILSFGQLAFSLMGSCGYALMLTGHQSYCLLVNLIGAIVLMAAGGLLATRIGVVGLATVSASVVVLTNVVLWILTKRLLGVWTHARPLRLVSWLNLGRGEGIRQSA